MKFNIKCGQKSKVSEVKSEETSSNGSSASFLTEKELCSH